MKLTRVLSALVPVMAVLLFAPTIWAGESFRPVVVELFTSQGCSSCPPADAFLGELAKRENVLALGFHVDYWNYIGWTDPFSSKFATQRQHDYASAMNLDSGFTPQMVVNGTRQGVGSDREEIARLINAATAEPVARPSLTIERSSGGGLAIHVGGTTVAAAKPATVWLVTYDREHTTVAARGENGGRTLKDYQVVRSFRDIGTWTGAPLDISIAPKDVATGTAGVGVLPQTGGIGQIIAATSLEPGV